MPNSRTVTDPDFAAGPVMLMCSTCGTRELTDSATVAGSRRIVCRKCGDTWPTDPNPQPRLALDFRASDAGQFWNARREPVFSDSVSTLGSAWAARIENDNPRKPETFRPPYLAVALGAAVFAALFVGGRQVAVAALPDLAGIYATLGLPVNLTGLAIEDVKAERAIERGVPQLTIGGVLRNVRDGERSVPSLVAELRDVDGQAAGLRSFDPPVQVLGAGGTAPFVLRVEDAPAEAVSVTVRFMRAAEVPPGRPATGEGL